MNAFQGRRSLVRKVRSCAPTFLVSRRENSSFACQHFEPWSILRTHFLLASYAPVLMNLFKFWKKSYLQLKKWKLNLFVQIMIIANCTVSFSSSNLSSTFMIHGENFNDVSFEFDTTLKGHISWTFLLQNTFSVEWKA